MLELAKQIVTVQIELKYVYHALTSHTNLKPN